MRDVNAVLCLNLLNSVRVIFSMYFSRVNNLFLLNKRKAEVAAARPISFIVALESIHASTQVHLFSIYNFNCISATPRIIIYRKGNIVVSCYYNLKLLLGVRSLNRKGGKRNWKNLKRMITRGRAPSPPSLFDTCKSEIDFVLPISILRLRNVLRLIRWLERGRGGCAVVGEGSLG